MTAKNVFTAGTDIIAADMNANFATLPWAMEVVTQSITGTGTINLTASRFHATTNPICFLTVVSGTSTRTSATVGTITYSGGIYSVPVYVWTGATAATAAATVQVLAIQQKSNASVG